MKCSVTECSAAGQSLTFRPLNERRLSSAEADHRLHLRSAKMYGPAVRRKTMLAD